LLEISGDTKHEPTFIFEFRAFSKKGQRWQMMARWQKNLTPLQMMVTSEYLDELKSLLE